MPSSSLTKFDSFTYQLCRAKHNLETDVLKVALTLTAPVATNQVLADITQISGGSYPSGGYTLDPALTSRLTTSGGVAKLTLSDEPIVAGTGGIPQFRYLVVYNDTQTSPNKPLIGFYDYGSNLILADGDTLTVDFSDAVSGGTLTIG